MTKHATKLVGWTASLLALAATASADIKLNDNFSVGGYIAGSYEYDSKAGAAKNGADSIFDASKGTPSANAVKTTFTASFKPVTAVISLFYQPGLASTNSTNQDMTVLDAYVVTDLGDGYTVKAGKYLTPLGYEAFDPSNMAQITYGAPTVGTLAAIPGYHTGVEGDYSDKDIGAGLGLVDSVYSNNGPLRGDGELRHNAGIEGYATYKAITDLTLWAGFAWDSKGSFETHDVYVVDVWAQYQLTKADQVAAEFVAKDGGDSLSGPSTPSKGYDYLVFENHTWTDKVSTVFRFSGESLSGNTKKATGNPNYQQYTFSPSYKINANFLVRAEYSFYSYAGGSSKNFVGLQGLFTF